MKIWLDDIRDAPSDDYIVCKTYEECVQFLENDVKNHVNEIEEVDLDNHLGGGETGYDVILWLEKRIWDGIKIPKIKAHSSDPENKHKMEMAIMCIEKTVERLAMEKHEK